MRCDIALSLSLKSKKDTLGLVRSLPPLKTKQSVQEIPFSSQNEAAAGNFKHDLKPRHTPTHTRHSCTQAQGPLCNHILPT